MLDLIVLSILLHLETSRQIFSSNLSSRSLIIDLAMFNLLFHMSFFPHLLIVFIICKNSVIIVVCSYCPPNLNLTIRNIIIFRIHVYQRYYLLFHVYLLFDFCSFKKIIYFHHTVLLIFNNCQIVNMISRGDTLRLWEMSSPSNNGLLLFWTGSCAWVGSL